MRSSPEQPMAADPICGVSSLGSQGAATAPVEEEAPHSGNVLGETARNARLAFEEKSRHLTEKVLARLRQAKQRGVPLRAAPDRMRRAADQLELCIDLIGDMRTGRYRKISWPKALLISGALLYSVSPADLIPDMLPVLGSIDDAIVLAVAMSVARDELVSYCEFRGYDPAKYFPEGVS